ncbi:sugar transferase [bacterium]|nr:sugar transferase [bacterium]
MKRYAIQEVWVNDPDLSGRQLVDIATECEKQGAIIAIVPIIGSVPSFAVDAVNIGGQVLIRERKIPRRPLYETSKRLSDFLAAFIGLILLSPLMISIGILIRITSKGPAIFRQSRIGKRGKPFTFYKYRTMYVESNPVAISPITHQDPRITPLGRFLRRTSLDELPQLFNVLLGQMSLVDPRPEMPFIVEKYS